MQLLLYALSITLVGAATYSVELAKIQSDCGTLYTLVSGDDCWAIAGSAGITMAQLAALNPELRCEALGVGDGVCLQLPCSRTYAVAIGEWCAKIVEEQNIPLETLTSLNPGFSCDELFPGQHLCLAPPIVDPPTPPPGPPSIEIPLDVVPTVPCDLHVAVAEGDTCYQLATDNKIQLSQLTAMNANLNCSRLEAGNLACVQPACGGVHIVEPGEWCAKIEEDNSLPSGKLVELNPGLSCEALSPYQAICVEPKVPEETPEDVTFFNARANFGSYSNGEEVFQSPLLDLQNAEDGTKTMVGKLAAESDSSHAHTFDSVDANKDGFLDLAELKVLARINPSMTRGLDDVQGPDDLAAQVLDTCDVDRDGKISKEEYLQAVSDARHASKDLSAERARLGKRILPLLLLFALPALLTTAVIFGQLEKLATLRQQKIMDYMDVVLWDREGRAPEPKCAIYVYYSSSCAALGHSWSSHCSEGGEKVFPESCRGLFTSGSQGCGFLGCSSMCYKVNTENCDCNCLNFTSEDGYFYTDTPHSSTTEGGVAPCRTKCAGLSGCTGFSLSPGPRDSTVTCAIFTEQRPMRTRVARERTVSYKSVKSTTGTAPVDTHLGPEYTTGLTRISLEETLRNEIAGRRLSDAYFSSRCRARTSGLGDTDTAASASKDSQSSSNATSLSRRAPPYEYDWRFQWPTTMKDQKTTATCSAHTLSTMVEAAIKRTYNRPFFWKDVSPNWIHFCRTVKGLYETATFNAMRAGVGHELLATESCQPFSEVDAPVCTPNQCAASAYGLLPYVYNYKEFPTPSWWYEFWNGRIPNLEIVERMKDWISEKSPLFMSFAVHWGFVKLYLPALAAHTGPGDLVFYDEHPVWGYKGYAMSGHSMAVVGYKHHSRATDPCKERLYWIVQNSWGRAEGTNGYAYIELGSLGNTLIDSTWGITVKETTYFFPWSTQIPSNRR